MEATDPLSSVFCSKSPTLKFACHLARALSSDLQRNERYKPTPAELKTRKFWALPFMENRHPAYPACQCILSLPGSDPCSARAAEL